MKKIELYDYQQRMLEDIIHVLTTAATSTFYNENGKKEKIGSSVMEQQNKRKSPLEEHVRDYTHGILISLADEPMAIHLLVRIIVKAYAAGLKCGSKEGEQHQLHMPTLHGMLLNNVNILLNETPLKSSTEDPVALFKEACKNEEENINVLFNTLNDAMKELAAE